MVAGVFTPYSTVEPMVGALPAWVPQEEKLRIASYQTYEEIYWNAPETFKLMIRGSSAPPVYVPSGRTIVDTTDRYVAPGFNFVVNPKYGTEQQQAGLQLLLDDFLDRENFASKFQMNKLDGIIKGDWLWHVLADPNKPEGQRLRILAVDPGNYFPVYADNDLDRLVKVHLAEHYMGGDKKDKERVKRLTYEYVVPEGGGPRQVWREEAIFEVKDWVLDTTKPIEITIPREQLPEEIQTIPVYHIKNRENAGDPYGSSEMRGIERIMAAINQAVSDEELALALEGLGMYWTKSAPPEDENGEETDWFIGPGRVLDSIEDFNRVDGVGSVQPYTDHLKTLRDFMKEATATSDAAIGNVDVTVAESGVALALRLAPMLAKAAKRDTTIVGVHKQMAFDLLVWFKVYEGQDFTDCRIMCVVGEKVPPNKAKEVELILSLVAANLMSLKTARTALAKLGYEFEENEMFIIAQEQKLLTEMLSGGGGDTGGETDEFGNRIADESAPDPDPSAEV